jgi:hypothetical protein
MYATSMRALEQQAGLVIWFNVVRALTIVDSHLFHLHSDEGNPGESGRAREHEARFLGVYF